MSGEFDIRNLITDFSTLPEEVKYAEWSDYYLRTAEKGLSYVEYCNYYER